MLYGRELFVLISLQGAWRCLRLKISDEWFRLFYSRKTKECPIFVNNQPHMRDLLSTFKI